MQKYEIRNWTQIEEIYNLIDHKHNFVLYKVLASKVGFVESKNAKILNELDNES